MSYPLYFEELTEGAIYHTQGMTLTEAAIIRFGLEWDFQSFHVDVQAAKDTIFGGLISSGLQTLCLTLRLYNELGVMRGSAIAGLGIDKLRWLRPARPGDTVRAQVTIIALRTSSKSDRGIVTQLFEALDQEARLLLTFELSSIVARRRAVPAEPTRSP